MSACPILRTKGAFPGRGQLRLAPSGHVIGIDMNVALSLASTRGYDLPVLSALLPAAEAGLVEALSTAGGQGDVA